MLSKNADSKVTKKWISDVKKAWKYHKSQIERTTDPQTLHKVTKEASTYFMRLQEDLLINKGFWYVLGPYSGEANSDLRDKVTKALHEAGQALLDVALAVKRVGKGFITKEDMSDMIDEGLSEVDRLLSRIVFSTLKRELKKVDELDMGSFAPTTLDIKGVKVVFQDEAEKNPHLYMHQHETMPVSPYNREMFIAALNKAQALLARKGFDHLWEGEIHIRDLPKNAIYAESKDEIYLSLFAPEDKLVYLLIHELGHRHWFKYMTSHDRVAFSAYFHTGEVDPVTEYGGTNPEEDFAEAFSAYVTGGSMDRDQLERFKQFFSQRISSTEKKQRIAKRIATLCFSKGICNS